jgi:hypothetical protein
MRSAASLLSVLKIAGHGSNSEKQPARAQSVGLLSSINTLFMNEDKMLYH